MKRRLKRAKDNAGAADADDTEAESAKKTTAIPSAVDEMQAISIFSASAKVRAAAAVVVTAKGGGAGAGRSNTADAAATEKLRVLCALNNNAMEVWEVGATRDTVEATLGASLYMPGHRSDVRAVAVSNDSSVVATCAGGEAKVWNVGSGQCFRTVPSGYGICCAFVAGDKHLLLGTKTGEVQLVDVASAELLENAAAHEGAVWALSINPNDKGFVSAGADKELKFWEFGALRAEEGGPVRLSMAVASTVTMEDDILAVTYSPDGKLLAVALLDTTVKIFFTDSMKFFLSLYGHRLPALAVDISTGLFVCFAQLPIALVASRLLHSRDLAETSRDLAETSQDLCENLRT